MLKHIKKIYSDLTEFFLVLFTGVFVGSIFTLAYIKYWNTSKVTFADIGGMLASVSTLGLLIIAITTTNTWKRSLRAQHQINALNEYFEAQNAIHHSIELAIINKDTVTKSKANIINTLKKHRTSDLPLDDLKSLINQLTKDHSQIEDLQKPIYEQLLKEQKKFVTAWAKLDKAVPIKNDHATLTQDLGRIINKGGFNLEGATNQMGKLHDKREKLIKDTYNYIYKD